MSVTVLVPVGLEARRPPLPSPTSAWIRGAACRGRTELFFGPPGERPEARREREATASQLCRACPVVEQCRTWARAQREYGFWAGESEEDRVIAGYPPALPTGRVAERMRAVRQAALGAAVARGA